MDFEFDSAKSIANRLKHGIDFEAAQGLWKDAGLMILPSKYPDEADFWQLDALVRSTGRRFVERGDRVRLISVRSARHEERNLYEQNQLR